MNSLQLPSLSLALILIWGTACGADPTLVDAIAGYLGAEPIENQRIQPDALADDPREDFYFVLDVRTEEQFGHGHITGAVNIPYSRLVARLGELPRDPSTPILVYCDTAQRSTQALMALHLLGYPSAHYLMGGLKRWEHEGRRLDMP
jgi:rhodanese-related sulfurtransferase